MKSRPGPLLLLSISLLGVGLSFPVQIAYLYEHDFSELFLIFEKLTILNCLIIGFCFLNAALVYNAHPHSVLMSFVLFFIVFMNNWWVAYRGFDYSYTQAALGVVGFLGMHALMLWPSARLVLSYPYQRWWLQADRKKVSLKMTVNPWVGKGFISESFDLSETGTFVKLDYQKARECFENTQHVQLKFNLGTLRQVRCGAELVRVSPQKGQYPEGIGLRFTEISEEALCSLKTFLKKDFVSIH